MYMYIAPVSSPDYHALRAKDDLEQLLKILSMKCPFHSKRTFIANQCLLSGKDIEHLYQEFETTLPDRHLAIGHGSQERLLLFSQNLSMANQNCILAIVHMYTRNNHSLYSTCT